MKEQLIKLLGLSSDASDDDVVSAVSKLKAADMECQRSDEFENRIRRKIAESCGALDRESAIMVLNQQH